MLHLAADATEMLFLRWRVSCYRSLENNQSISCNTHRRWWRRGLYRWDLVNRATLRLPSTVSLRSQCREGASRSRWTSTAARGSGLTRRRRRRTRVPTVVRHAPAHCQAQTASDARAERIAGRHAGPSSHAARSARSSQSDESTRTRQLTSAARPLSTHCTGWRVGRRCVASYSPTDWSRPWEMCETTAVHRHRCIPRLHEKAYKHT